MIIRLQRRWVGGQEGRRRRAQTLRTRFLGLDSLLSRPLLSSSLLHPQPDVAVECSGYILEELRDPANFEQFKKDVEGANIFIGSLIFVQELADKVIEVVEPNRDRLDAVCVFPSMPGVMRLNKIGSFTMASMGQSKNVMGEFMKKNKPKGTSFQDGMLKLVRTLPKVLKYLPGDKAADARSVMMSLQYWLGGSPENIEALLLHLANNYVEEIKEKGSLSEVRSLSPP